MFEKTVEIASELKRKKALEEKTLPLLRKIKIADDCLETTKDRKEYQEILQIRKELVGELELERKGFFSKEEYFTGEEASAVCKVVGKEIEAAEKELRKLQSKAEAVRLKYLEDMGAVLNDMSKLNFGLHAANDIKYSLPEGYSLNRVSTFPSESIKVVTQINENLKKRRFV